MNACQPPLQIHLALIFPLSGKEALFSLPLFPDTLIFPLAMQFVCQLLSLQPVFLLFLGSQLLHTHLKCDNNGQISQYHEHISYDKLGAKHDFTDAQHLCVCFISAMQV